MTLGDVISNYRREHGMSMADFSKISGISKAYISMLEKNKTQRGEEPAPSIEMYRNVADAIGIDVDELVRMVDGKVTLSFAPAPNLLPALSFVRKPRLGRVACGQPILAEEHIEDYDLVPSDIKCDFTLVCKGDSMINARIFDGDIVCVRQQEEVENGEIAVVMVDEDEATLKRFYRYDDHIELRAENPSFRDKAFWDEDMARVRVLGRATHCIAPIK